MEHTKENNQKKLNVAVLIDGNNFYKGLEKTSLRDSFDISLFDYEKFVNSITVDDNILAKRYYKGVIKKEEGNIKSQRMVSAQQSLFSRLEKDDWEIRRGKMSKNIEFGKCIGFCFVDKLFEEGNNLKEVSKEIVDKYRLVYRPIIIASKELENQAELRNFLGMSKEDDPQLKELKGLYFILNRWREKGVDVNMAIDMVGLAYENKISETSLDKIILISSDSDLKPAIKRVQELGVNIEYIGFEHMYSLALLGIANNRLLLTEKELKKFLSPRLV